ncbi:MAG: nucleotidyltransferase domain-containing protein, partial [Nanoarchaeota archaeon]|nr:nucleotidyltransferase domain-containing protein [Nanoarchaeota archaeon]
MEYGEILATIKPSQADVEKISQIKEEVMSAIRSSAETNDIELEVVAGGSTAKGTFLKGDFDIDIFARFKTAEKNISDQLELLLSDFATQKDVLIERIHGSRDYFTFSYEGLFFEIVPVKFVRSVSEVENVTDMSPLHVFWMQKHSSDQLKDDIRLAKQFCKSALVYGAESFINGVSGHVLDILMVHYGSFNDWIKAVASWSGATVIDTNKDHDDVFSSLNQSKLVSPLIVIDPVDKGRNAAAALSQEKYNKLISKANAFLLNPSKEFFIIPSFDLKGLQAKKQQGESLFVLEATPQVGKKDVV